MLCPMCGVENCDCLLNNPGFLLRAVGRQMRNAPQSGGGNREHPPQNNGNNWAVEEDDSTVIDAIVECSHKLEQLQLPETPQGIAQLREAINTLEHRLEEIKGLLV